MIALGLIAVASVFVVASEQPSAVSVRAQAGSWGSDHPRLKIAKGTSKLDWGGAEEYMADDAAKIATNQANVFDPQYGQTPPPINKGYLDEIEQAQGEQAQEVVDNAAIAMVRFTYSLTISHFFAFLPRNTLSRPFLHNRSLEASPAIGMCRENLG